MAPSYPPSTAVFDLSSVDLIRLVQGGLNAGVDFGGQALGKHADPRTHFTIGTGFEPEALDMEAEMSKLAHKIDAGADYIMTQPAFGSEPLTCLDDIRRSLPVLIGVLVLTGLDHALRMRDVPGMVVPDTVLERLGASRDRETQAAVGQELAAEQVRRVQAEGWAGVYLMSPATHQPIMDVLAAGLT
jgi:homocysteine S-methyltransferase